MYKNVSLIFGIERMPKCETALLAGVLSLTFHALQQQVQCNN